MRHEVRFSGFGGQGIILSAVILGRAAVMYDNKFAVQTQVYGPEARGGASMSAVIIDDNPILYPKVAVPGIYVIMSQEGFEKYGADAQEDAVMLVDSTLVHSRPACRCIEIPATQQAKQVLKKDIVANIVMLGALVASTHVVTEAALEKAILDSVPKGTEALNQSAMKTRIRAGQECGWRKTGMKLREYEAKNVIREAEIPVPTGFLIRSAEELKPHLDALGDAFVLKAQVDVGGRGKAGGILMADRADGVAIAQELFRKEIKGLPVKEILAEQRLAIQHEYYLSITVDRSSKQPLILFTEAGGVDIEITAKEHPEAIRKVIPNPLMRDIPPFMLRELLGTAPKEIGPVVNKLYRVFLEKDALLAEINPLVTTPRWRVRGRCQDHCGRQCARPAGIHRQPGPLGTGAGSREVSASRMSSSTAQLVLSATAPGSRWQRLT